ncbi:hypothetical protein DND132_2375 [Pseudodesulfovibrio mercurii]|uniref:Uncharacterized protein n=1 Tax=Pseudodesulfovibrio mercurii TaxID=641491 RepID=F0JC05_9BACT|nr:hypothetical protein [Pseudodesulfovibrio mercurii]EGB15578.1 hypothetical protein DND132_2375 [Pseudodesulfovibrio mercurii]
MGGSEQLLGTVFGGLTNLLGVAVGGSQDDALKEEREARAREEARKETEERRRDRDKVLEAREVEDKRGSESLLSQGAASLTEDPEVSARALKTKLGE